MGLLEFRMRERKTTPIGIPMCSKNYISFYDFHWQQNAYLKIANPIRMLAEYQHPYLWKNR